MKKILFAFIPLLFISSTVIGDTAAPYSEEAWQKIVKATNEVSKEQFSEKLTREEYLERHVGYYSKVFEQAGYNFNETIKKIIDDLRNNPEAIPRDRQSVYNNVYIFLHLLIFECNIGKIDVEQFFPADMKQQLVWFKENSEFTKQDDFMHHGFKE